MLILNDTNTKVAKEINSQDETDCTGKIKYSIVQYSLTDYGICVHRLEGLRYKRCKARHDDRSSIHFRFQTPLWEIPF